jgi:hypothetical protein
MLIRVSEQAGYLGCEAARVLLIQCLEGPSADVVIRVVKQRHVVLAIPETFHKRLLECM